MGGEYMSSNQRKLEHTCIGDFLWRDKTLLLLLAHSLIFSIIVADRPLVIDWASHFRGLLTRSHTSCQMGAEAQYHNWCLLGASAPSPEIDWLAVTLSLVAASVHTAFQWLVSLPLSWALNARWMEGICPQTTHLTLHPMTYVKISEPELCRSWSACRFRDSQSKRPHEGFRVGKKGVPSWQRIGLTWSGSWHKFLLLATPSPQPHTLEEAKYTTSVLCSLGGGGTFLRMTWRQSREPTGRASRLHVSMGLQAMAVWPRGWHGWWASMLGYHVREVRG